MRRITMCYHCKENYIEAGIKIKSAGYQKEKSLCDFCGYKYGYDYWVGGEYGKTESIQRGIRETGI